MWLFFKSLEDALLQLYKLYKWPLCWSGLQEVGEMLLVSVLKPAKVTGTRWIGHRDRALKLKGGRDSLCTLIQFVLFAQS